MVRPSMHRGGSPSSPRASNSMHLSAALLGSALAGALIAPLAGCAQILGIDDDRCIGCYCCIEMCPHAALKTAETPAGRAAHKLAGLRDRITHRTDLRLPRRRAH